ncbi:MAG: YicC/YloC family endoribonuclease [Bacteroidales bacterium]|nr:YicC/YloC family endoribonuclease [Bacteroidales bacterium]MEE0906756.1 YicC/YloC family endoribonuclease [Muribaculaceae bacterium]
MILSMTGFGKAVVIDNNRKITAEIKSLNSKQLDLAIRLPQAYREIELDLRNQVAHSLERGKVDLYIYTEAIDNASAVNLNLPLLKEYKAQIERMSEELNIPLPVDWYATLLRMPDAIKTDINGTDVDESELKAVIEAVEKAMEALIEFRTQEGARLQAFFTDKIANIQALLGEVDGYEAERVAKIKGRIQESLNKLESVDYDQNRFEQEMIFYIEKLDITEEKIRLQNHLNYFLSTMEAGHGQGKKLGFISQEMGREINTLGSKSNHAELQKVVVRMKDELEQIKEQVLNVM